MLHKLGIQCLTHEAFCINLPENKKKKQWKLKTDKIILWFKSNSFSITKRSS